MMRPGSLVRPPHRPEGFPRYAVCGLGLMGGSLAMALRHFVPSCQITGIERDPARLEEARRLGLADELRKDLGKLDASEYDVVFLAVPVGAVGPLVGTLAAQASEGALVSDLGSVKGTVQRALPRELPAGFVFVGGHPMTGSHLEGLEGVDPHMFENAVYVLTPGAATPPAAVKALRSVLEGIGALVREMDPDVHDRAVATISHLPYLLACGLLEVLEARHGRQGGAASPLAAGGFHGATRVAACPPELFRDILVANREALGADVRELMRVLATYAQALDEPRPDELLGRFRDAQALRRILPSLKRGLMPSLPEAIIKAKDVPGFIGQVAGKLGAEGINIRDLEVLHSREGEGGTLRVAFENTQDRARALEILGRAGFMASERDT